MIADAAQAASVRVPVLAAPPSESDMREGMVAEEIAISARAGVSLDRRAAERLIASDLAIADAVVRESTPAWARSIPDPQESAARDAEQRQRLGAELSKRGAAVPDADAGYSVRKSKLIHATSMPDSSWSLAKGRIARILSDRTEHPDIRVACSTCVAPGLALEIVALQAFVMASLEGRHTGKWRPERPGDEPNPFWGLSPDDFGRKMMRLIEDICDRSTGIPGLGPWRVPK